MLSLINIFNLSFYSSCFLFSCLVSFCYFMHCVHTNVITSQCWSCSNQFPSVELIRSSASISADHFCQHVVFGFGICLFLPIIFFVAHSGRNVRADYQKQSSFHRIMVTFDKSDSAAAKQKKLIQKSVCLPPSIKGPRPRCEECSPVLGLCTAPHPR